MFVHSTPWSPCEHKVCNWQAELVEAPYSKSLHPSVMFLIHFFRMVAPDTPVGTLLCPHFPLELGNLSVRCLQTLNTWLGKHEILWSTSSAQGSVGSAHHIEVGRISKFGPFPGTCHERTWYILLRHKVVLEVVFRGCWIVREGSSRDWRL